MFKCSSLYLANLNSKADIVVNQGGTYSGKTYSIMQCLYSLAISDPNKIITVTGEDIPNLKRGSLRDALGILNTSPELKSVSDGYNGTERIFKFKSDTIIEFVSYMNEQDARNGKRDYLFINEAQGLSWGIAEQLINRTNIRSFIDYNPSYEFWPHEKLIIPGIFGNKKVQQIISDHRHNPFLTQAQHDHIEMRALEDPEWGRVYARGMTGKIEGLIFRNFIIVPEIPKDATLVAYGADFGFTNDPSTLIAVYKQNGELWLHELLYERGLTNQDLSDRYKTFGIEFNEIIADSAEPKSIEELYRLGWNVHPADKGADSIKNGIDILKRYKLNITSSSTNLLKEIRSYKWAEDKEGNQVNKPVDFLNHAIDAIRYVALNKLSENTQGWYVIS